MLLPSIQAPLPSTSTTTSINGSQSERGTSASRLHPSSHRTQTQSAARYFPHLGPSPHALNLAAISGREDGGAANGTTMPHSAHSIRSAAMAAVASHSFAQQAQHAKKKSAQLQPQQMQVQLNSVPNEGGATADTNPDNTTSTPTAITRTPSGTGGPAHVRRVSVNIEDVLESPRMKKVNATVAAATAGTTLTVASAGGATLRPSSRGNMGSAQRRPSLTQGSLGTQRRPSLTSSPSQRRPSLTLAQQAALHLNDASNGSLSPTTGKPCSVLMCAVARVSGEGYCPSHLSDFRAGIKLNHKRSGSILQRMLNPTANRAVNAGGYGAARRDVSNAKGSALPMYAGGIGKKHGLNDISAYDLISGITEEEENQAEARIAANKKKREMEKEKQEKMSTTTSFTPQRRNSKTILNDTIAAAAAAVAKINSPDSDDENGEEKDDDDDDDEKSSVASEAESKEASSSSSVKTPAITTVSTATDTQQRKHTPDAAKFYKRHPSQRRYESSNNAPKNKGLNSTSSDWMHSPDEQAARLLRLASKAKRVPSTVKGSAAAAAAAAALAASKNKQHHTDKLDSQHKHPPHQSSQPTPQLSQPAVESTVDQSLAQLPFQRYYFNLPQNLNEFIQYRDSVTRSPEGAAVCLIIALIVWSEGREKEFINGTGEEDSFSLEDREEKQLASLLTQQEDQQSDDLLPLHVISSASARRNVDTVGKMLMTPKTPGMSGGGSNNTTPNSQQHPFSSSNSFAPTSTQQKKPRHARLASFHRPNVNQKKIVFLKKKDDLVMTEVTGEEEESKSSNGNATTGPTHITPDKISQLKDWTMETRWMGLIATIHPDQLVEAKSGVGEKKCSWEEKIVYRSRSLCPLDISTLTDTFSLCPHLARTYILGTVSQNKFALPKAIPPPTPPQEGRKIKFGNKEKEKSATTTDDPTTPSNGKDSFTSYWDEVDSTEFNEYKACLQSMSSGNGSLVIRLARHPFASGTADTSSSDRTALIMIHNSGLKYPKSIKLRKDQSGRWKCVHWWNVLQEIPLADEI